MAKTNDLLAPSAVYAPLRSRGDSVTMKITYAGEPETRHNDNQGQDETQIKLVGELIELELSDDTVEILEDENKTAPEDEVSLGLRTHVNGAKRVHPSSRAVFAAMAEVGLDDTDDLVGCTLTLARGKDEKVKGISYPTYTAEVVKPKRRNVADLVD